MRRTASLLAALWLTSLPPQLPGEDLLRIQYLGVGGFWLSVGDREIMTAPMYTNPGMLKLLFKPIAPDRSLIRRFHPPRAAPAAILVGHAHYDHLMDVPAIYEAASRTRTARGLGPVTIYGSSTTKRILAGYRPPPDGFPKTTFVVPPERVIALDDKVDSRRCVTDAWLSDPSQCALPADRVGEWVPIGDAGIRIRALCSAHPKQVLKAVHLWPGCLQTDRSSPPAFASDYPEGPTFAYLIDFLDATGQPEFRIYYQDAPSNGSIGRVPLELIDGTDGRPVDVALLGAGNWDSVFQPEGVIGEIRPTQVILGHWENFFRPQTKRATDAPTQSFGTYESRIREQLAVHGLKCKVHKPKPQEVFFIDRSGNRVNSAGRILERAR